MLIDQLNRLNTDSSHGSNLSHSPCVTQHVNINRPAWTLLPRDHRPSFFNGISRSDSSEILAASRIKDFARGETLHMEGDSVRHVMLLTSGLVKITKIGSNGAEVILKLGGTDTALGVVDPSLRGTHNTTAQAFRSCRALVWEAVAFNALIEPFPVLHQNIAKLLGQELHDLQDRFREVATERVGHRVANQVMRLVRQIGRQVDGAVEIALSREELAQMTGTTLFTVSRLFSAWEARGIVKPRREAVLICDLTLLGNLAGES